MGQTWGKKATRDFSLHCLLSLISPELAAIWKHQSFKELVISICVWVKRRRSCSFCLLRIWKYEATENFLFLAVIQFLESIFTGINLISISLITVSPFPFSYNPSTVFSETYSILSDNGTELLSPSDPSDLQLGRWSINYVVKIFMELPFLSSSQNLVLNPPPIYTKNMGTMSNQPVLPSFDD